jgi:hypothetical protein
MTDADVLCLWGCNALAVALNDHGIQCAICFPLGEAPCVRVPGVDLIEAIATCSDRFEVWSLGDPPAPVPLRVDLTLGETIAFLAQAEGRA